MQNKVKKPSVRHDLSNMVLLNLCCSTSSYTYVFGDRLPIGTHKNIMRPNRKGIKPIWRPLNLKCTFLHYQTRYQRNSRDYTYVFGDRLSVGTHDNTMRPNRKWNIPTWRSPYLKCMFLQSQTRYQRNSIGYTYVFGVRLPIGTHEHTIWPKLKLTNPRWWPVTLKWMYLHSKLRYQRNSNGYTYVCVDRLSFGTHENTMQPNRKWKIRVANPN